MGLLRSCARPSATPNVTRESQVSYTAPAFNTSKEVRALAFIQEYLAKILTLSMRHVGLITSVLSSSSAETTSLPAESTAEGIIEVFHVAQPHRILGVDSF